MESPWVLKRYTVPFVGTYWELPTIKSDLTAKLKREG